MTASRPQPRSRWRLVIGVVLSVAALAWGASRLTATTRQGVNYRVSTQRIPLFVKAVSFLHRHQQYRLLADRITAGLPSERERALALFDWTRRNIRRTPSSWPVVDDHVLHIIIRGHGHGDQMADVFTTLAAYAGMPAFWMPGPLAPSFVQVDGQWAMFDVGNNLVFADEEGRLLDARELLAHPELVRPVAGDLAPGGTPYEAYVRALGPFQVPPVLRARQQMPLPRLVHGTRRVLHLMPAAR